jgi:EAL domain-containing protein (putative c-di-GMP-specific phosphodiesterase class I)
VLLASEQIIGFEALLRWQHPERGLVSPADFIPVAEETGLIVPLGLWVLREACRQMADWHDRFPQPAPPFVSVNLSTRQLLQANLVAEVAQALRDTGLDPASLKLEITETAIMQDPESAAAMLVQLRDLGVRVGLDDFGTGYSSLNYLRRFALSTLKIDRSFISQMDASAESAEIVQTIVSLAHNLAMDVVAEGIEKAEQRARLQALACEYGQGYYFSRPLDSAAAAALLSAACGLAAT